MKYTKMEMFRVLLSLNCLVCFGALKEHQKKIILETVHWL